MAELQDPSFLGQGCTTAQIDRQLISSLVCVEGIAPGAGGELEVTTGGGMSVNVASGNAFVAGTESGWQGMYHVSNDATENVVITAANPTDDRIDLIVARVRDADESGVVNDWLLQVVTGTASPSPVAPALPDNSLLLATVTVTAAAAAITGGMITDERTPYVACATSQVSWLTNRLSSVAVSDTVTVTVPQSDDGDHSADWSLAASEWTYNGDHEMVALIAVNGIWSALTSAAWVQTVVEANQTGSFSNVLRVDDRVSLADPDDFGQSGAIAIRISPGDIVRVRAYQDSSGSQTFGGGGATESARMSVTEVMRL